MNEFKVSAKDLLKKVEELIHEGNIRRIIIKNSDDEIYLEIPLTIGLLGALCAPVLAAVGALAGMAAHFKIEVIRKGDAHEEAEIIEETEDN